jgi:hypothetical protein
MFLAPGAQLLLMRQMNTTSTLSHPSELWLARFASNDVGLKRRKSFALHLEACADCRKIVSRHREMVRRYRDFERCAISNTMHP